MNARIRASIATLVIICLAAASGIAPGDAAARVAALSDAEIEGLAAGIGELPAGPTDRRQRLSMTRFALPMERSTGPIFTSALMPM